MFALAVLLHPILVTTLRPARIRSRFARLCDIRFVLVGIPMAIDATHVFLPMFAAKPIRDLVRRFLRVTI